MSLSSLCVLLLAATTAVVRSQNATTTTPDYIGAACLTSLKARAQCFSGVFAMQVNGLNASLTRGMASVATLCAAGPCNATAPPKPPVAGMGLEDALMTMMGVMSANVAASSDLVHSRYFLV